METKICSKCGEEKPLTEYYKSKKGKYGYDSGCKSCRRIYLKKYAELNKTKYELYRREHRDMYRDSSRRSYQKVKNQEAYKRRKSEYYIANRARFNDYAKKWIASNKIKLQETVKKRVSTMKRAYIVGLLVQQTGLPTILIRQDPELIQLKRLEIALKRKRKEITEK